MISAMRKLGFLLLIALTFYLPKLVSDGGLRPPSWALPAGQEMPLATQAVSADGEHGEDLLGQHGSTSPHAHDASPVNIPTPVVARRLLPFEQFLRFDVTPQWVTQQFSRVTILPRQGVEGMRVALITGTREDDLTGSLTYYFDDRKMVQRITIEGATGNPSELVAFVSRHYKLKEISENVYVRRHHRVVLAGLLIERPRLIEDGKPAGGYRISLEINRPQNYSKVSSGFHSRLIQAAGA